MNETEPPVPTVQQQAAAAAKMIFALRNRALQLGGTCQISLTGNRALFEYMLTDAFSRPREMEGVFWYCDPNLQPGRYELHIKVTSPGTP